jgi:hypothetical protein
VRFNYETESWERDTYNLPWLGDDFVLLTPKDILTRDENWINRHDLIHDFESIPPAISDAELRGQVSNYFHRILEKPRRRRPPSQTEKNQAAVRTLIEFPELIDYYIKLKEDSGDEAANISEERVFETTVRFHNNVHILQNSLVSYTHFYEISGNTYTEAHQRLAYLKDIIENKGGHRIFYINGKPIRRESDLQILYRLVWFGSPSDVGREANDGRGPADFKISRGAKDKTLVEMKLASNSKLEQNLKSQLKIYKAASDAGSGINAIIYFSKTEQERAEGILDKLGILGHRDIVLIDARDDNKPSGSKA